MSNTDNVAHTFTSGTVNDGADGVFDTSFLVPEDSFEWKPESAGEYPYFCMVHPWMSGMIIVAEDDDDHGHGDVKDDDDGSMMKDDDGMMKDDDYDGMMKDDGMMRDGDKKDYGDPSATGMLSDGTMIKVWASEPAADQSMQITVKFKDAEHVNYDIMVAQNGESVLSDEAAHTHDGKMKHETAPLASSDPVDISITFQGYGVSDPKTGPIDEMVAFSNIVPEFGTVVMIVLTVAIISMVAVTARSGIVPRL